MKKFLVLILGIFFFYECSTSKEINVDTAAIKKEVHILLVNWHKAASEANFEEYFGKMDSAAVYIGTAAEEIWTKKQFAAFSKPYFDKGKAWNFKTLERNVYVNENGNFVWFDELLITWMGTCRGSGVLEKKDTIWKIKHYVLSVTIPNDDIQAVILAKKKNDALFLEKY
ncbi:nuclear transport factor 2 family protein [uncultured Polaribacter sp.]|uniref:nuclear transport factor 2 family protein n=1 Tax=uncultured Polaribacter sp. TaxID=174711 RepID=UPI002619A2ED|nr:nuclear transport factor 2 family protein [uncultured Polaribacter sp.]